MPLFQGGKLPKLAVPSADDSINIKTYCASWWTLIDTGTWTSSAFPIHVTLIIIYILCFLFLWLLFRISWVTNTWCFTGIKKKSTEKPIDRCGSPRSWSPMTFLNRPFSRMCPFGCAAKVSNSSVAVHPHHFHWHLVFTWYSDTISMLMSIYYDI